MMAAMRCLYIIYPDWYSETCVCGGGVGGCTAWLEGEMEHLSLTLSSSVALVTPAPPSCPHTRLLRLSGYSANNEFLLDRAHFSLSSFPWPSLCLCVCSVLPLATASWKLSVLSVLSVDSRPPDSAVSVKTHACDKQLCVVIHIWGTAAAPPRARMCSPCWRAPFPFHRVRSAAGFYTSSAWSPKLSKKPPRHPFISSFSATDAQPIVSPPARFNRPAQSNRPPDSGLLLCCWLAC